LEEIAEAFDMVLGEDFVDEMVRRLIIIFSVVGIVLAILIVLLIWRLIAKGKIKKAMLVISEYPDKEHCEIFLSSIKHITRFGKGLAKVGLGYSGLSKGECRTIFNTTVVGSQKLDSNDKKEIRKAMISVGCTGLLSVE